MSNGRDERLILRVTGREKMRRPTAVVVLALAVQCSALLLPCARRRCGPPLLSEWSRDELSRDDLELVLTELENIRSYVSSDIAKAAMLAAREKSSIDAFISTLQDEVLGLGQYISEEIEALGVQLDEESTALAERKRVDLTARAEALLDQLERAAPRRPTKQAALKTPYLPRGASVVFAGHERHSFGELLAKSLDSMGHEARVGPAMCPPASADPNLPPSSTLRSEIAGADALVLVCSGAVGAGGVSPTVLAAYARVLPKSMRRVLLLSPRGVDRTFTFPYALRNALGSLDAQRAAEQNMVAAAAAVGAVCTVMRVEIAEGKEESGAPVEAPALRGVCIADGDQLSGPVDGRVVARAVREALRRSECEGAKFSLTAGASGDWDDEFLKLSGPEVARFPVERPVSVDWIRDWARELETTDQSTEAGRVLLSNYVVLNLPTRQTAAAAKNIASWLPSGARIHWLASGAEYVGKDEAEERIKGDFDGAIDLLVEEGRVRLVRAEMEPVWRRTIDGGRKQVTPLVKGESEARLLKRLFEDLEEFRC